MKKLAILLIAVMTFALVGCSAETPTYSPKHWMSYTDRGYQVPYKAETLVYDVTIDGENTPGTLTMTFKSYPQDTTVTAKAFEPTGDTVDGSSLSTTKEYQIKANNYTLEATLTFSSGTYTGDHMYYFCQMDSAMNPIASYRELIFDYEATANISRNGEGAKPMSQVFATTYSIGKATSKYATRSEFGSSVYNVGSYEGALTNQPVDTMQLIYSARSISTLASGGTVSSYISISSPIENTVKEMSLATYSQDVAVEEGAYITTSGILGEATAISCTAISVTLYNETVSGQRLVYYYSNDALKVDSSENALNTKLVPVKLVEGETTYTLREMSIVK